MFPLGPEVKREDGKSAIRTRVKGVQTVAGLFKYSCSVI